MSEAPGDLSGQPTPPLSQRPGGCGQLHVVSQVTLNALFMPDFSLCIKMVLNMKRWREDGKPGILLTARPSPPRVRHSSAEQAPSQPAAQSGPKLTIVCAEAAGAGRPDSGLPGGRVSGTTVTCPLYSGTCGFIQLTRPRLEPQPCTR